MKRFQIVIETVFIFSENELNIKYKRIQTRTETNIKSKKLERLFLSLHLWNEYYHDTNLGDTNFETIFGDGP